MIAYYVERGHSLSELLNMTYAEKLFMLESIAFNNRDTAKNQFSNITTGNKEVKQYKVL